MSTACRRPVCTATWTGRSRSNRRIRPSRSSTVMGATPPEPSAPSSLDFGVESFQFHAGVFDTKLPIDAALFAVRLVRPGRNFSLQYGQFTDAAVAETLAR